jgi:hypothetical protein
MGSLPTCRRVPRTSKRRTGAAPACQEGSSRELLRATPPRTSGSGRLSCLHSISSLCHRGSPSKSIPSEFLVDAGGFGGALRGFVVLSEAEECQAEHSLTRRAPRGRCTRPRMPWLLRASPRRWRGCVRPPTSPHPPVQRAELPPISYVVLGTHADVAPFSSSSIAFSWAPTESS